MTTANLPALRAKIAVLQAGIDTLQANLNELAMMVGLPAYGPQPAAHAPKPAPAAPRPAAPPRPPRPRKSRTPARRAVMQHNNRRWTDEEKLELAEAIPSFPPHRGGGPGSLIRRTKIIRGWALRLGRNESAIRSMIRELTREFHPDLFDHDAANRARAAQPWTKSPVTGGRRKES